VTPIHLASTFAQQAVGKHRGFDYSRTRTRRASRSRPRSPRSRGRATATRSRAAWPPRTPCSVCSGRVTTCSSPTTPTAAPIGSSRACMRVRCHLLGGRAAKPDALRAAWRDETRLVWVETPSNPKLNIVDIEAVAAVRSRSPGPLRRGQHLRHALPPEPARARRRRRGSLLDEYLGGHSDVVGGLVATSDEELATHLGFVQNSAGAVPSPFDCYLVQARAEDPRGPPRAPVRERAPGGRAPAHPPGGAGGPLPGARPASGPRARQHVRCSTSARWCPSLCEAARLRLEVAAGTRCSPWPSPSGLSSR